MGFRVGVVSDHFDDGHEQSEELSVAAVVEGFEVLLDLGQFLQVDYCFGGLEDFLLDAGAVHVENTCQDAVGDQFFVAHDLGAVEGGDDLHEETAGLLEVPHDQPVDPLVDLQLVLALPVATLLEKAVALVDVVLDLGVVVEDEVDGDELEGDVHLFANLDGLLQGQVVGLDGLVVLLVLVEQLSLGQKGVPDFCLAEVLLSVLDFEVGLSQQLVESFLDVHDSNYF